MIIWGSMGRPKVQNKKIFGAAEALILAKISRGPLLAFFRKNYLLLIYPYIGPYRGLLLYKYHTYPYIYFFLFSIEVVLEVVLKRKKGLTMGVSGFTGEDHFSKKGTTSAKKGPLLLIFELKK